MAPRGDFAALLVNAGDSVNAGFTVLVTGGASSPTTGASATASAQILLQINGDACTIDEDCLSGFCTDGVCCNKRCDEECYACRADLKESQDQSGDCSFAQKGSDPHQQCLNNVETHTMCDGLGSTEQDPTLTKSCLPGICAGDELSCSTSCQTTANCDLTGWCDVDGKEGDPNQCAPKKVNGAPCDLDEECVNTRCVDKVCCNADCDLQCQACNLNGLVGTCSFVGTAANPGDVQPNTLTGAALSNVTGPRTACNGVAEDGSKSACTGACTGEQLCTYPTDTAFLQADACADDPAGGPSVLTSFPCDGDGSNTSTTATCAGFKCESEAACKTTCALDTDCIIDFVCTEGACVELTGPLCDGIKTLRNRVENGGYQVCPDSYACPPGANACLTECQSINDCIQPDALPEGDEDDKVAIVCNGERKCVPEPEPAILESCSASPAGTGPLRRVARRRSSSRSPPPPAAARHPRIAAAPDPRPRACSPAPSEKQASSSPRSASARAPSEMCASTKPRPRASSTPRSISASRSSTPPAATALRRTESGAPSAGGAPRRPLHQGRVRHPRRPRLDRGGRPRSRIDEALTRLATDHIDIVHLHSCPEHILLAGEVTGALSDASSAGKVGIRAYSGENAALDAAVASGSFGSVQISLNPWDQGSIDRVLWRAKDRGLGAIAKRPLANAWWTHEARPDRPDVADYWNRARALALPDLGLPLGRAVPPVRRLHLGNRRRHRRHHEPRPPRRARAHRGRGPPPGGRD